MSDATRYLDTVLPQPEAPQVSPSATAGKTLAALIHLCENEHTRRFGPTVGVIALKSGLSIAQTQRDLIELQHRGQVVEVEKVKADGYQLRYLPGDV